VQDSLDHSFKSMEEVEVLLSVPALAMIPIKRAPGRPLRQLGNGKGRLLAGMNGNLGLEVLNHATSAVAESFRSLRTSTLLSMAMRPPQTILVTSSKAGEGKTTTAVNLALALAQQHGDVLIIDCDMRNPGVARVLSLDGKIGLSTVLTGRDTLDASLQRFSGLSNLWALTTGPLPPNPAELLSSPRMVEILRELQTRFRHIVIDSPPLLLVTDATVLSAMADGVILVVQAGLTPRKAVVRAYRMLHWAGAKTLGVVLNKVDLRFDEYYGAYYSGGHYGHDRAKHVS
jgi:capsular exopolysaccharide synthesis family protein